METIAFAIGLDPILTHGQQLVDQYRTWTDNKQRAPQLSQAFASFETDLAQCLTRLRAEAEKLPRQSRSIIERDVATLADYLASACAALQSLNRRLSRPRVVHFFQAQAVSQDCDTLLTKLDEARKLLRDADKHADLRCAVQRIETGQSQAPVDSFREFFPPVSSGIGAVLDFDTRDENGNPVTTEGRVKQCLLQQTHDSPNIVSIHGIGGVGKSTIVRALSIDDQIQERFPNGVHLMKLGKDASNATLFRQLCQVLKDAGAEKTHQSLRIENDVDAALHSFESWFREKRCAFLIDDVWKHGVGLDLLSRLCKIGRGVSRNSVLITTREHEIASLAPRERVARLEPRETRGRGAREILFFHADHEETDDCTTSFNDSVIGILDMCAGLPVSLAAAGKNVKKIRMDIGNADEEVWKQYLSELVMCRDRLLRENVESYGNVFATFATSISFLDQKPREETLGFPCALSPGQMYRRLCALEKPAVVPSTMLKHLWKVESVDQANVIARAFVESGLANREAVRDGEEEYKWYVSLHDSLHDFAVAEARRHGDTKAAHECLLKGYVSCDAEISQELRGTASWWSPKLEPDRYIHQNVCRHLIGAGRAGELVRLLMSPEWVGRQLKVNGLLSLETDFALGIKALEGGLTEETDEERCEVERALELISEAAALSSTFIAKNMDELCFQLHGRLRRHAETNLSVREYVDWIETNGVGPLVLCKNSILGEAGGANTKILPVSSAVNCITLMKDGERIACGCRDGRILVVDPKRNIVEKQWKAHNRWVFAIAVGMNGQLVSGSSDNTAKVWESESGRCVASFNGHSNWVRDVAVTRNGKYVISVSDDRSAQVWDIDTGRGLSKPLFMRHSGRVSCVAVLGAGEEVVTGGEDEKLRLWNVTTGTQIGNTLDDHEGAVSCVCVTRDGRQIVSGSYDKTVRLRNVGSHRQIGDCLKRHTDSVFCVAVSEDGRRIVSGAGDKMIRLWDTESWKEICEPLKGHTNTITGVLFLNGIDCIVSCSNDETVRQWDVRRKNAGRVINRHGRAVSCVSFTPCGKFAVSGSYDETLRIWDTTSLKQVGEALSGHSEFVNSVAVTPDGRCLVSVSDDETVLVWDLESHQQLRALTGHTGGVKSVAVTPHGEYAVTGSDDKTVRTWDLSTMEGRHDVLMGHSSGVARVYVSDDGLRIISVDFHHNILVWELEKKKLFKQISKENAWKLSRREVLELVGETTVYDDTKLSIPRGARQIVYGEGPQAKVLATMETEIWSWVLSPDQKTICLGLSHGEVAFLKLRR